MGPHSGNTGNSLTLDEQKDKFIQAVKETEKQIKDLKGRLGILFTTKYALIGNIKNIELQLKGEICYRCKKVGHKIKDCTQKFAPEKETKRRENLLAKMKDKYENLKKSNLPNKEIEMNKIINKKNLLQEEWKKNPSRNLISGGGEKNEKKEIKISPTPSSTRRLPLSNSSSHSESSSSSSRPLKEKNAKTSPAPIRPTSSLKLAPRNGNKKNAKTPEAPQIYLKEKEKEKVKEKEIEKEKQQQKPTGGAAAATGHERQVDHKKMNKKIENLDSSGFGIKIRDIAKGKISPKRLRRELKFMG